MDIDPLLEMARLALRFGRVNRTGVYHPPPSDAPESDTDHTVMLGWVAPDLAARYGRGALNVLLVAQFALVHDAVEVYAGDTPTLRIDEEGLAQKDLREHLAFRQLSDLFSGSMPFFVESVRRYEAQVEPEARFVRAVDKILPKLVALLNEARGLRESGMGVAEFVERMARQKRDIAAYAGEWPELGGLHYELVARLARELEGSEPLPAPWSRHYLNVNGTQTGVVHSACPHPPVTCPVELAFSRWCASEKLLPEVPEGVHELGLDDRGGLVVTWPVRWSR